MDIKQSIGWTTKTWNPVTGCWGSQGSLKNPNRCFYCYAHRTAKRLQGRNGYPRPDPFSPTFHPDRLAIPSGWKKPTRIFVCSMADLFGDWVPPEWIQAILKVIKESPRHTFLFLTKNPIRYHDFYFPQNCWLGATGDTFEPSYWNALALAGLPNITFLTYEPLLDLVYTDYKALPWIDWVIVGAMTGYGPRQHPPEKACIRNIIGQARKADLPVFMKENLRPYWNGEPIQQWPENHAETDWTLGSQTNCDHRAFHWLLRWCQMTTGIEKSS